MFLTVSDICDGCKCSRQGVFDVNRLNQVLCWVLWSIPLVSHGLSQIWRCTLRTNLSQLNQPVSTQYFSSPLHLPHSACHATPQQQPKTTHLCKQLLLIPCNQPSIYSSAPHSLLCQTFQHSFLDCFPGFVSVFFSQPLHVSALVNQTAFCSDWPGLQFVLLVVKSKSPAPGQTSSTGSTTTCLCTTFCPEPS